MLFVAWALLAAPKGTQPQLADGCGHVYLDVGSNIGVQVRKLFEPEKYPGAPILPHYDQLFGKPDYRRKHVCAFG